MLRLLQVCIPKNIRLQLDLPKDLPRIWGNAAQIRQIVMNLVLNAEEAFGERTGTIEIRAWRERLGGVYAVPGRATLSDGEYICMEISDTGLGMTEEIQSRIFDPSFSTKIQGRGLGLATVQRIVRDHRGVINVNSTPGVGTRFEILLPCAAASEVAAPQLIDPSRTPQKNTVSILIIEDEETLRVSVSKMLRRRGFSVLEAPDGDFAVNLIRTQGKAIEVVLLDLTLPGKPSLEILEELQRSRPDAKVILTSAYGWEGVGGRLRALHHEFIRKPYQVSELVSLVRNAILPLETGSAKRAQSGNAK
jgi:CheY-like chemotaxis protein